MILHYKKTHLEDFVEQMYAQHKIFTPDEITVSSLSKRMNITVQLTDVKNLKGASFRSSTGRLIILLDKSRSSQEQRVDFFHELGHLLRHAGNQLTLPDSFIRYQEATAEQFTLYALMPISMIKRLEFSPDRKQAIHQLAETFTVGTELASKRYDQILRRELEGVMIAEAAAAGDQRKEVNPIEDISNPQFHVYYDPTGAIDGPSQLVITLDEWTLINCHYIKLPIGERLPEIDLEELQKIEYVPAFSSDVICFDGTVTLQVSELLYRYGLSRRCFIVQMRDVEMKMTRDEAINRRLSW